MPGLTTYTNDNRTVSMEVGWAILQAGKAGFLTDSLVQAATSAQDLIDDVNAAVVAPGGESYAQRLSIARSIQEGKNIGDLSDSRVQAATGVQDLASKTWVDSEANFPTHLGVNIFG